MNYIIKILISIALIAILFFSGYFTHKAIYKPIESIKIDTMYIHTIDTIKVSQIAYKWAIKTDTVYVPKDTIMYVEQKCYEDTFSTIWISGIDPKIDSIEYCIPKDTIVINTDRTIILPQKKCKSGFTIAVGPNINYGYDFINDNFTPNIGIGITIGWGITISK